MRAIQHCWYLALLLSLAAALPAHAEEADPKVREKFCQSNPERCREIKARRDAWCKEHKADCEAQEARREALRTRCEEDPAACEKKPASRPAPVPEVQPPTSSPPPGNSGETFKPPRPIANPNDV